MYIYRIMMILLMYLDIYNTFHLRDNLIIKYDAQYFDNYQIFKFSDYFRTLKEERKQKLNKIKNGNI